MCSDRNNHDEDHDQHDADLDHYDIDQAIRFDVRGCGVRKPVFMSVILLNHTPNTFIPHTLTLTLYPTHQCQQYTDA